MTTVAEKIVEISLISTGTVEEHLSNTIGGDLLIHSYPAAISMEIAEPLIQASIAMPSIEIISCGS